MTYENEKPDTTTTPVTKSPKHEKIILSWILVIAVTGVVMIVANYLQDFL